MNRTILALLTMTILGGQCLTAKDGPPPPGLRRSTDCRQEATFAKTFRWRDSQGQGKEPVSVELVGSVTQWHRLSMRRDPRDGTWEVTIPDIPGHRTHRYMLLVDGQPTFDDTCDGLTAPEGAVESQYQLPTAHGPRLCLLFSNTK